MGTQEEYWNYIEGKNLLAIDGRTCSADASGPVRFELIRFFVEGYCLQLDVNVDTDEIVMTIEASVTPECSAPTIATLGKLIGKEFFWLWMAENSQGYMDTVMMSFAHPAGPEADTLVPAVPQIAFVGAGSSIHVFRLLAADD